MQIYCQLTFKYAFRDKRNINSAACTANCAEVPLKSGNTVTSIIINARPLVPVSTDPESLTSSPEMILKKVGLDSPH